MVDVFCRVPLMLVNPAGTPGAGGVFRFSVSVRDSAGLELVSQSWLTPIRDELLRTRGASTTEHMTFAARAGRYAVQVTVTDSASGRIARAAATVDAFDHAPGGSDLLLGSDLRSAVDPGDTVARGDEVRRGPLFLVTSGEPVLTPQASRLAYYLELYPVRAESVMVAARVLTESGTQLVAAAPTPAAIGTGGGFTNGFVDLAGLPPGRYRFEVTATGPDSQVVRSAMFGMTGFETVVQAAAVVAAAEWPASLAEPELDEAYQPLIYLMSAAEQGVYSSLSVEGKRKWLRQFWARRDPTPRTGRNEERDRFYSAIEETNHRFREGGASAIPGWRTDRGRIFIKYGAPDEVVERKVQTGSSPYEIWKYMRNRNLRYVFIDLTRFGNYTLIYTNDIRERSRPDWRELLGDDGLRELEQNQ
jgi:GWxTD domain-containing protein